MKFNDIYNMICCLILVALTISSAYSYEYCAFDAKAGYELSILVQDMTEEIKELKQLVKKQQRRISWMDSYMVILDGYAEVRARKIKEDAIEMESKKVPEKRDSKICN